MRYTSRTDHRHLAGAAALGLALVLANCAGSLSGSITDKPETPKVDMTGRWLLSAPNAPACGVNFTAASDGQSGRVAPEGGCPGDFFTSRQWSFEAGGLLITNHNNEPLALLNLAGGHFEGKSTSGLLVTLARPAAPTGSN